MSFNIAPLLMLLFFPAVVFYVFSSIFISVWIGNRFGKYKDSAAIATLVFMIFVIPSVILGFIVK